MARDPHKKPRPRRPTAASCGRFRDGGRRPERDSQRATAAAATTATAVAEAFLRLMSQAAALGMSGGDDVEMQQPREEVEVVQDFSLRSDPAAPAAVGDDLSGSSPPSSSSPTGAEARDENEANQAAGDDVADEEEALELQDVAIVVTTEQVTIEQEESVESASPVDFSFEVSPPLSADDGAFDVDASLQHVSTHTETIVRYDAEAEEQEQNDEEDDEAGQEPAASATTPPQQEEATEARVCKHCGLEFPYVLREMKNHTSKCEGIQHKRVQESEPNLHDEVLKTPQDDDGGDKTMEVDDEDQSTDHEGDQSMETSADGDEALEHEIDQAMTRDPDQAMEYSGGDETIDHDGDDVGDAAQGDRAGGQVEGDETQASPRNDEAQAVNRSVDDTSEPGTSTKPPEDDEAKRQRVSGADAQPDEAAFRLFVESSSTKGGALRAECLSCGTVLAHNKRTMSRHTERCQRRLVADAEEHKGSEDNGSVTAESPTVVRLPVLKVVKNTPRLKATKRKLIFIEDAIAGSLPAPAQEQSPQRRVEDRAPDEPQQKFIPPPPTADFQTPRRSKRIKRDPTHSPAVAPIVHEVKPAPEPAQPSPSPPRPATPPPPSPAKSKAKAVARRKAATPHKESKAVSSAPKSTLALKLRDEAETKAPPSDAQAPALSSKTGDDAGLQSVDRRAKRVWLFGTLKNADAIKSHYHESAEWIHASCSRFQHLIRDHLFDLKLAALLEHVPPHVAVILLADAKNVSLLSMETAVGSKSDARVMYNLGLSLSFPAPATVHELLVMPLAHDLKASPLVEPTKHSAATVCCRAGFTSTWRFQREDVFVFLLKGSVVWRTKKASVLYPVRAYCPQPLSATASNNNGVCESEQERHLGVHSKSVTRAKVSTLLPSVEDYHMDDQDDDVYGEIVSEATLEPGSVVYMPGGTWFEAEVTEDSTWLEVRIASFTPTELVCDALKQLLSTDEQWRKPLLVSQDAKPMRRHLGHLLKDLSAKVSSLSPSDLLPEVLLGSDDPLGTGADQHPVAAGGNIVMDIRLHAFKGGKFSKVFKTSGFKENPLAVLMAMHEIPCYTADTPRTDSVPTHGSTKKALKKKPKRKPAVSMTRSAGGENVYVVRVQCDFSSSDFQPKLRVQFQCNAFQAAVVEWVREKQGTRFHVAEVLSFAQQLPTKPHDDEDATKYVLRFLQTVGFLSPVKIPAPEKG